MSPAVFSFESNALKSATKLVISSATLGAWFSAGVKEEGRPVTVAPLLNL
jgi:hypothetical protein